MSTKVFTSFTQAGVNTLLKDFIEQKKDIHIIRTVRDIQYAKTQQENKTFIITVYYVRTNV